MLMSDACKLHDRLDGTDDVVRRHDRNEARVRAQRRLEVGGVDGVRYVRSLGFTPEAERAVLGGNAAALLGITAPALW